MNSAAGIPIRPETRIGSLDGVRGIAILMVIFYHGFFWSTGPGDWPPIARALSIASRGGWLGVDLFFVLSGFLITGRLLDTKDRKHYFRDFYMRRALRILPLYYAVLLCIILVVPGSFKFACFSFFFLSNLTPLFGVPMAYGPLWSLAVEEHFYLIWPWLVRLGDGALWLVAAVCVGEPIARAVGYHLHAETHIYSWFRLDGLAWGGLLALVLKNPDRIQSRRVKISWGAPLFGLLLLGVGLPLGITTRRSIVGAALQYVPWTLMFVGLVAAASRRSESRALRWLGRPALRTCGDLSYCLYLVHVLLFDLWDRFVFKQLSPMAALGGPFGLLILRFAVVVALSFGIALLSRRYLEFPVLQLKWRFANDERV